MGLVTEKTLSDWVATNWKGNACYMLHYFAEFRYRPLPPLDPGSFPLHISLTPLLLYEKQLPLEPLLLHPLQNQAGLTFQHPLKLISLDCIVKLRLFTCTINLTPNASTAKTTTMGRVSKTFCYWYYCDYKHAIRHSKYRQPSSCSSQENFGRRVDIASGIQSFQVSWISKASAAQRAGRAGRTGPGHCDRLYPSALYEHYFESSSQPEILRTPIEGVVLQMKSMNIDAVVNFPFPTPPDRQVLKMAETVLTRLGALSGTPLVSQAGVSMSTIGGQVTPLGKATSLFPLSPRFSRMLVGSQQHGCLPYVILIVAAMSVGDPCLREEGLDVDSESDSDDEGLGHIKSASIRAKEARRARRRTFSESQQARLPPICPKFY
ncbi:P-loop containing nucleoside triphosphate hydrolase protein [Suillus discolor]|uniref:P-loop containing nucleoside triphosphate hydrolase protein n=1 Tax=Suillus discolor TaxID=1912936 RepID=A0A9P7F798_9AGAM|nr:P-loop containing nucleoside triphosphate hydrolase protein [Suillus discolor]KAG2109278.1 P-loop containing nucleoside triphosphate hydrolase protein [Suillus discolor]